MRPWMLPALVFEIALAFRFYALDSFPPGLHFDEAMEGNQALDAAATGKLHIFYPENFGREGMFVWLAAVPLRAFGNHPWALRTVSAFFGLLTVVALYFFARSIFDENVALIASFLLATSFWHTNFSRTGLRAILAPFFLLATLHFLFRALRNDRRLDFVVSGLICGLGFYTYIAFRVVPLILLVAILAHWRTSGRKPIEGVLLFTLASALVATPLALYFYLHPNDFVHRALEASVSSPSQLWNQIGRTIGMFNYAGDPIPGHSLFKSPVLPAIIGIFFIFGLGRAIAGIRQGERDITMLTWLFVGLVPVALSDAPPNVLRALIVAPVAYIFAAKAIWATYQYVEGRAAAVWPRIALVGLLAATSVVEGYKYFGVWAQDPVTRLAFFNEDVKIGNTLNKVQPSRPIIVYVAPTHRYETVQGIPMNAQTLMFVTGTFTNENQRARNIRYVTSLPQDIPSGAVVVSLN
jgi:4-amino-4-deoxy-L-arabinose transferase-like glycosyltransferase